MTLIQILIAVPALILVIFVWMLTFTIAKSGAISDFNTALLKCKDCKRYKGHSTRYRLISCNGYNVTPEEVERCKHKIPIKKKNEVSKLKKLAKRG